MFQKRHYETVAASVHRSQMARDIGGTAAKKAHSRDAIRLVAIDLATSFRQDNPNFDRARFMTACGFPNS